MLRKRAFIEIVLPALAAIWLVLSLVALSLLLGGGVSEGRDFEIKTTPAEGSSVTEFPTAIQYHAHAAGFRSQDLNELINNGVYNDIYGSGSFAYTIQSDDVSSFRLSAVVKCLYTEEGDEWAAYVILYPQDLPDLEHFPDGKYTVTLRWSSGSDSFSFYFINEFFCGTTETDRNAPPPNSTPTAILPTGRENLQGIEVPPPGQSDQERKERIINPVLTGPLAWLTSRGSGVRVYDSHGNLLPAGGPLEMGCTIVTDEYSTAQLQFQDGSSCNIGTETSLAVVSYQGAGGESSFELANGSFQVVSGEVRGEGRVIVGARGIICILGVRGTVYEVDLTPEGNMEIRLYEGSLGVRGRSAQSEALSEEVFLEAGTYVVVSPEGIPSEPMALSDSHYERAYSMYGTRLARPGAAGAAAEAPPSGERVPGWAWFLMGMGTASILALAALSATLLARRPKAGA